MDADKIRSASLAGRNNDIRRLLISDTGRKVCRWVIDRREATTRDVAEHFDISVQQASGILSKLWRQMYLRRSKQKQESGGYEWNYYP